MIILEDTRQAEGKHEIKHSWFEANGIEVRRTKLYVGDYTLPTNQSICVDTKKDIQELVGDIIGQHERFKAELIRAQEAGIKLYILVENESFTIRGKNVESPFISRLEDLHRWVNPRLWIRKHGKQAYPNATRGITLQKACCTMQKKYGCEFVFCTPRDAGRRIIELLGGKQDG
jgi:ribosome-associated protein